MTIAIAEGVFDIKDDKPVLLGGRRKSDGAVVFPKPQGAEAELFEDVQFSRRGILWSFTIQRFPPKSPPYDGAEAPAQFKPFAVGYVEIPGEAIIESRLVVDDFNDLKIGMDMELILIPFQTKSRGEVQTYAFAPIEEKS